MSVVVLIPTYQRPETLKWSLKSVLLQDTTKIIDEKLKIVILNNDTGTKVVETAVQETIDDIGKRRFNEISIIHRDPPILGIYNFYNGIFENTSEGDIAILHGDDDIMLQGSLTKRYFIAKESNAAFNICNTSAKVYFFRNDINVYLQKKERKVNSKEMANWSQASKEDLLKYSLPFVSAYCYKIGPEFWYCYEEAKKWAEDLPLEPKIRLPFLPFYMGISAWLNKQLVVIQEDLVLRGQLLESRFFLPPRFVTEYANTGIIMQTGLAVLNNSKLGVLKELDELRIDMRKATAPYLFFSFFKRDGVTLTQLRELYSLTKTNWMSKEYILKTIIENFKSISRNILFLNNLRNRLSGWGQKTEPQKFWSEWASF